MGSRRSPTPALMQTRTAVPMQERLWNRLLDPIDRLSEAIYSILIVLTFTMAYHIWVVRGLYALQGDDATYTRELFWAVLGAALAWGLIDGIMYAMLGVLDRGERHKVLAEIKQATDKDTAVAIIADELDDILEPITSASQRQELYSDILDHLREGQAQKIGLEWGDITGAIGSVLVAVLAIIPCIIPLLLFRDNYLLALRAVNLVCFIMLFWLGYSWGKYTGTRPWRTGFLLALFGLLMVIIAIPLGG
jgi:VIT1/CCC1 family predicted Fe2+/Mn2+ transporter